MVDRAAFLSSDRMTYDYRWAVPNEAVTSLVSCLAGIKPGTRLLELGYGSGFQAAHFAELGAEVFGVDSNPSSAANKIGNGLDGWPEEAPFDCIVISFGIAEVPHALADQLKDGGVMVIPLGKPEGQELLRLEKRNGKLVMGRVGGYCRFQMCS